MFTTARHLFVFWRRRIHSTTSPSVSWVYDFIVLHHLRLGPPSDLPPGFPTKTLYSPFLSLMRATCFALQILDLMDLIIFGREYKSWSCAFCSLLQSLVTPAHFRSTLILIHPQPVFLHCERPSLTPIQKQQAQLYFCFTLYILAADWKARFCPEWVESTLMSSSRTRVWFVKAVCSQIFEHPTHCKDLLSIVML